MITINFIASNALNSPATSKIGRSLMETALAAGISGIAADCGGLLTCATCHVFVQQPFAAMLPPPDAEENAMLEFTAVPRRPASRLSCQIQLTMALDGLTVELPATQY
jgi:ferredoxin, 2Fe-2S